MSIAEPLTVLKAELLQTLVPQVLELLTTALREGTAVHQVEDQLWDLALQLGRRSLTALFQACGTGDLGKRSPCPTAATSSAWSNCTRAATCRSSGRSASNGPCTAAGRGKPWHSCPWTIACNCPRASSPTCCKTGTSRWPWSRRSAR